MGKIRYTSKYLLFLEMLDKTEKKKIEYEINDFGVNNRVIITSTAVISINNKKVNVTFYNEIMFIKKNEDRVFLYDEKMKILDTLVGTNEYPVDIILQELKNKNPKIKRIRENTKKKKRMGMLNQFYDRLTYRQQEIFYGVYLLVDFIVFLIMEMLVILILGDGTHSTNIMVLPMIFVLMVSVYICKKTSDKYKTYWLKGVQYILLIIKVIFGIMGIDAILM